MSKKILVCPCHYYFSDTWGSEVSWSVKLADNCVSKYPGSVVVTGYSDATRPYRVIKLLPLYKSKNMGLVIAVLYNLMYTLATLILSLVGSYPIVHHVLPFKIGHTFNLYFISPIPKLLKQKLIIGPIQNPLQYCDTKPPTCFLVRKIINHLSLRTLKSADKIIAINQDTKNTLLTSGVPGSKITVIPPGVECGKFKPRPRPITEPVTLITCGQLIERKNISSLIFLLHRLQKEKGVKFKLNIVGTGPEEHNLKNLAKDLQATSFISFLGKIPNEEMPKLYNQADIYITLSKSESWGQAVVEAMASGLPIVCCQNSLAPELISDKWATVKKEEGYANFSMRVSKLIASRYLRNKKGRNARAYVQKYLDWNVILPKYEKLYETISE